MGLTPSLLSKAAFTKRGMLFALRNQFRSLADEERRKIHSAYARLYDRIQGAELMTAAQQQRLLSALADYRAKFGIDATASLISGLAERLAYDAASEMFATDKAVERLAMLRLEAIFPLLIEGESLGRLYDLRLKQIGYLLEKIKSKSPRHLHEISAFYYIYCKAA